jgi:hypothetical protein
VKFVGGAINKQWLQNVLSDAMEDCVRVRAAVAYASRDNMLLFEACQRVGKPLVYYGRYDHTVPVHPQILKWFLDQKSPGLVCKLVPDILHAKVIWWEGAGVYLGSANLSERAWFSNIEAGLFIEQEEMTEQGIDIELEQFFDRIDSVSHELTLEHYQEIKQLADARAKDADSRDYAAEQNFDKTRRIPKNNGLVWVDSGKAEQKQLNQFIKEWDSTLQLMRDLGSRVSRDENRPSWLSADVPAGVQADQFLHAYYYQRVREGSAHPYDQYFEANKNRPEQALQEIVAWWRSGTYDHHHEENTVYAWAPTLRTLLSANKLLTLAESEFVRLVSMVHAMRDHAAKQRNVWLGLAETQQPLEIKVEAFARRLFAARSAEGKSALDTINYVLYGGAPSELAIRLWAGTRSATWRIPHIGLSSLGEIAGWAMPNIFPPRNGRSSKALRALGNNVTVYF